MKLTEHQVEMLSGAGMFLGTVDESGRPDCARCFGATVDADRTTLRVLIPAAWSEPLCTNLRDGGWAAFSFTNPLNYESFQAKGKVLRVEEATDEDREVAAKHKEQFARNVISIGVHDSANYYAHRAAIAITLRIDQLFCQTPGPGAGDPVGGES